MDTKTQIMNYMRLFAVDYPHLRFGQIISFALAVKKPIVPEDLFYVEDDELLPAIRNYYNQLKKRT